MHQSGLILKPTGRKPLPEHLPREDVVHQPDDACCPQCGRAPGDLGEDVAGQLDYVPGHWLVIVTGGSEGLYVL